MLEQLYHIYLKHPVICTDTRDIKADCIFFALKGETFNGNKFADEALNKGAAYVVIDELQYKKHERYILVEDVLKKLQELANYHRKKLSIPFIAITGSNGKTTTKELIAAVLSKKFNVLATKGNLNNHIGVPLTLLSINHLHEIAIIEMGANHQGEIHHLCTIAEPDYGIITNIGKAHLEGFGGIEGVKKGKGELYKYIQEKKGKIFLHADDNVLIDLAGNLNKITYGTKKLYDIIGILKDEKNSEFISVQWATRYTATALKNSPFIATQLVGTYNYYNILCAICVGNYFNVDANLINQAISEYTPSNNRSQLQKTNKNTLILDYYNANPSSMTLAIENFSKLNTPNKMVILGDMLELGEESEKEHLSIIALLKYKNINSVILVGPHFMNVTKDNTIQAFVNSTDALEYIKRQNISNYTILIKGSRGIKLEKVLEAL